IWLVGGTVPIWTDGEEKVRAAALVFDAKGERVARYDKIHLFDVAVPDSDEHYQESQRTEHGDHIEVFDTPCGRIGLAVCYDLRFPELFRAMIESEVTVIAVPSAFTEITGRAHWETLVRARAIENLCFVVAAAQGGYHISGRETHGHSMIVDPWGNILAEQARGGAVVTADYDVERLHAIRKRFPALSHRRIRCEKFEP
ncbi:MAG: carbon-nitrogen hydrolase family protein, partial [Oceanobacter sp.]